MSSDVRRHLPAHERPSGAAARRDYPVLPGLDTVRALGAFLVLATHVAFWSGGYDFTYTGTLLARLDVGVPLFFVLSGFLLSRPFLVRARLGKRPPELGSYLWKRGLRVLPVYWVVTVLALVFLTDNSGTGFLGWVRTLTLTDIYLADRLPAGLTQMWSLATEVAFYAFLPVIMLGWNRATRGNRTELRVVAMLALSVAVTAVWVLSEPQWLIDQAPLYLQWLPTTITWFVVGIALSQVHDHVLQAGGADRMPDSGIFTAVVRLGRQPGVCWVLAVALFAIACTPLGGPPIFVPATPAQLMTKMMLYAAIGGLIVLGTAFADERGRYARVMAAPAMRHLGHISYGVFCIHILVLHLISHVTDWVQFGGFGWQRLAVTLMISVAAAEVLHFGLERPLQRLRGRRAGPSVSVTTV